MSKDVGMLPDPQCGWRDWIVPLECRKVTLARALESAQHLAAQQRDIPLIVQLCENPKYDVPGLGFHGAVTLHDHDCIHALLGRGLLPKDEAFVIGFTMGSTNRVSTTQEKLYEWASRYLYPKPYRFRESDIQVFRDAVRLGYISDCQPLSTVDYDSRRNEQLGKIRADLGIETDLLRAYYGIERRRYPRSKASQRLLTVDG